jgi:hypothetical protein
MKTKLEEFNSFLDYRKNELEQRILEIEFSIAYKEQCIGALRELEMVKQLMTNDGIISREAQDIKRR